VLDAIAEMPIQVFATGCTKDHSTNEFQARAACVTEIVREVQGRGVARVRASDRPAGRMLWIADAVSWAVGSGPRWSERLGDVLIDVIETQP